MGDLGNNEDFQEPIAQWFENVRERYSKCQFHEILSPLILPSVDGLRAFCAGNASVEESARSITSPISESGIPSLGTYSDETVALISVWNILLQALLKWPSSRAPDILALLSAIGHLPDTAQIHRGEATDHAGSQPLKWNQYPYFGAAWCEYICEPDIIIWQTRRRKAPILSHSAYVYRKDIEAQFISCGILPFDKRCGNFVAKTLENQPDTDAPASCMASSTQDMLEFQVPAVASLMRYCRAPLFDWVVAQDHGMQRWIDWGKRLGEIADSESSEMVRNAAGMARIAMQAGDNEL